MYEGNDLSELCIDCLDTKGQHIKNHLIFLIFGKASTGKCNICKCKRFAPSGKRLLYEGSRLCPSIIICPLCKNHFSNSKEFDSHKGKHVFRERKYD